MRGQAYEGAAAMASVKVGCQARIASMNKLAVYTHCRNHVLNLNIVHGLVRGDRDYRANLMPIYGDLYQIKL